MEGRDRSPDGSESRAANTPLRLRDAGPADVQTIYRLRNADEVRLVSRRQHPLDYGEFERDTLDAIRRSDAEVLVIEVGDDAAGYVRIEPRSDGEYEIGIALEDGYRGRGFGTLAIREATHAFLANRPGAKLLALTRQENPASGRAFEAAGFRRAGERGDFVVYRAETADGGAHRRRWHASVVSGGDMLRAQLRKGARLALPHLPIRGKHRFARVVGPLLAPSGVERVKIGRVAFPVDHRIDTYRYIYYGAYEQETVRHMRNVLRPGDVSIDAGANIGYITAEMAAAVGPAGRVYAFEPSRTCLGILTSFLPEAGNVEVIPAAVSERTGSGLFFDTDRIITRGYGVLGDVSEPVDATPYDVPTWAIDDFCAERGVEHIRYLKLDVEGSELAALRGARRLLQARRIDFVHVETSFAESDSAKAADQMMARLLEEAGYRPHRARRRGDLVPVGTTSYADSGTRDVVWASD